jgi:hypothetical protein
VVPTPGQPLGASSSHDHCWRPGLLIPRQAPQSHRLSFLAARPKPGKVDVVWTALAGAHGTDVYRSEAGGDFERIAEDYQSQYAVYADFGLTNGVEYCCRVEVVGPQGERSAPSNEACATPLAGRSRR